MNKTLKKLKELQNYWTNTVGFNIKDKSETISPTAIKSFSTYEFQPNIQKKKDYGSHPHSCKNSEECSHKIQNHFQKIENNNNDVFKTKFQEQLKNRQPLLNDHWKVMSETESYVEDCEPCNAKGHVDCTTCDTYGTPTGRVSCGSCWGSGRKSCGGCGGSGKSNDKNCFSCMGSGKKSCFSCSGSGKVTCGSCDGSLVVTCSSCKGHKCFTFYEEAEFNMSSSAEITWQKEDNKDWINKYIINEINDKQSHIDLMQVSDWHFHTLNISPLASLPYKASIQGQLITTTSEVKLNDNDFFCLFLGDNLEPYKLDFIFENYISKITLEAEKNDSKAHISFFENKIVENIVDEKGSGIPVKSEMIKLESRQNIKNTFKNISISYKEEQDNIDVKDILTWTAIFSASFLSFFLVFGLFTPTSLDLSHLGFTNIFINTTNTFSMFLILNPVILPLGIIALMPITYGIKKLLASSKESILRFSAWHLILCYFVISLGYLLFYPQSFFEAVEWGFNFDYLSHSFNNLKTIIIDVLLASSLLGILRARRINCLKVRKLSDSLNNDTLKMILGYDKQ
jgi:hypothetical protein